MDSSILLAELLGRYASGDIRPGVASHSGEVVEGDIFVAMGSGVQYIHQALAHGALAAVYQADEILPESVAGHEHVFSVSDIDEFAGQLIDHVYGDDISAVDLIGITGTNGKTSTAYFTCQLFENLGIRAGYIGTLGYGVVSQGLTAGRNTTPDRISLYRYISRLYRDGCEKIVMEVSSHALTLGRIRGLAFDVALFTNLSRDHLDFHGDMQAYERAKQSLFSDYHVNHVITNLDDSAGTRLYEKITVSTKATVTGYTSSKIMCGRAFQYSYDALQNHIKIKHDSREFLAPVTLHGKFNIQNMAAAILICNESGIALERIANVSDSILSVPGRLECINRQGFARVCIDYAHTPAGMSAVLDDDALSPCMSTSRWCLFGCGGDRDRGKRPLMGEAARSHSDNLVIADDNVRFETGEQILCDILAGIEDKTGLIICRDRQHAVQYAMCSADSSDLVLLLGKGDEQLIDYGVQKLSQSDRAIVSREGLCQ